MSTYVTNGSESFTPTVVDGYNSERTTDTVVHQILGRANPDVTIRPANLRTGTLRMIFGDTTYGGGDLIVDEFGYIVESTPYSVVGEADSKSCADAHAAGGVFSLVSSERSTIEMSYVADGAIRRSLDDETRNVWILEVDFHEVET